MILLIDNYDSFVYNLYQLIGSITPDLKVIRNDACTVEEIEAMHPESIVISPGPGRPEDAGNILEVIRHFTGKTPILGVCLQNPSRYRKKIPALGALPNGEEGGEQISL